MHVSSRAIASIAIASFGLISATTARAAIVPFTEHFNSGHANWYDPSSASPVNWIGSGGPDGSAYVSTAFNFVNQTPGLPFPNNVVSLFRAQDEFASSNHAFEGDWINSGGAEFSFWIRHNAPTAMTFFTRFSTPGNFPAWSGVEFTPVAPNVWTQINIEIYFGNPNLFYSGFSPTYADFVAVFGNIGHVQVGVHGGDLAGTDHLVTFDLDQPSLIPAPGVIAALGLLGFRTRSRRRRT